MLGRKHQTVKLDTGTNFFDWAHEHRPEPRWTVDLDLWQLSPAERG